MDGSQEIVIPPRVDTSTSWLSLEEDTAETWLLTTVADILDLRVDDVHPHSSFVELGGDQRTARILRKECKGVGLLVQIEDVLWCETLAELLTRARPCEPQGPVPLDTVASVMLAPVEDRGTSRLSVLDDDRSSRSRHSSAGSSTNRLSSMTELEQFVNSQEGVARMVAVESKAGLLEGMLVALLTLTNRRSAEDEGSEVDLLPQPQALFAGTQVASLRETAAASLPADALPDVWIVLARMPLESSGQVDRRRLRTWVQNMNDSIYRQAMGLKIYKPPQSPTTEREKSIQQLVAKVLRIPTDQVGVNFTFCQLGGDEMSAMELIARCKHGAISLHASEVLGDATLSDLASLVSSRRALAHRWDDDSFDLSPMQMLSFQSTMGTDPIVRAIPNGNYRFNQSFFLQLRRPFSFQDISAAVEAVVDRHPMLRSRFTRVSGNWRQRILAPAPDSFVLNKHTIFKDHDVDDVIERTQKRINIETGPVFAADYFSGHGGQPMLYLAAHHLVVDIASWRVIIRDLDEMLQNGTLSSQSSVPFQKWVELQKSLLQGTDPASFLPFQVVPGDYSYWGLEDAPNTYGDAVEIGFSLSAEQTSRLQSTCNRAFRTDSVDIYLATLLLSFAQTFKDRPVPMVWNQEQGRDAWDPDVDVSETVGWFTALCPVSQSVASTDDLLDVLRLLKDLRRSIPSRGSPYFASRFYGQTAQNLFAHDWPFEVIFSDAGSLQSLEHDNGVLEQLALPGGALASRTSDVGPKVGRIAPFEVSAMIDHGIARIKFFYNRHSKHQERILAWVHSYESLLIEGIERLQSHPQELTRADVPHLDVTYEGLAVFNKERLTGLRLGSVDDIEAIYPVTAVEQSILISQTQRPETCYLHATYEFASPSGEPIDISRICHAWQHVTARHAALRTIFTESVTQSGLYDKIVLRRASPEMLFIDTVSDEDPIEELSNLPTLILTDTKPNHRLTVCKAPTKTLVKLDISTALCDSLSIYFLIADLRRAYVTDRSIPDAMHFLYPPYLEFLRAGCQEQSLSYWLERLRGIRPCLFPRLTIRPDKRRVTNCYHALDVTWRGLSAFARSQGTSVGAILRLAWALILRSYTGSNRVCFGYQTIGRDGPVEGMQHAVGSFAHVVPCAYDLAPDSSLGATLQAVEQQLVDGLVHRPPPPIEEIQHGLGMRGGQHLFNSCLAFTEEPAGLNSKFTTRTNFEVRSISHQQTFDVDIAINTRFLGGNLVVDVSQRIVTPEQAINVANTFGRAISVILKDFSQPIVAADLFSNSDYTQITAWGSDSNKDDGFVVHDLVSRQVAARPDAQAVCSWDGELTYRQLDDAATNLAHYLVDAGVGPHVIVPVVMEKNRLAPVAMLAVLKSGAAFVPIEAEDLSLIQPIFDRLNSHVAIASESAAPVLGNLFEKVIRLNDDLVLGRSHRSHRNSSLASIVTPEDIACVLFAPAASKEVRGFSFSHAALSTTFAGQGPAAQISSQSRVMQLSSFNLDIALAEIFTTLIHGGSICIPSPPERLYRHFAAAVNRMQVNWTYMTPLMARKLDPGTMAGLEVVCFRTRNLDEDTYGPWHGKVKVILAYGALDVCPLGIAFHEVEGPHELKCIGRPFSGNFWITNSEDSRRLAPIGAIGELLIQAPTLGWPYPNNEPAQAPLPDMRNSSKKRSRYFKTGHHVRYTEAGLMQSVHHNREKLEIDGHVVDLAETERYLRRCLGKGVDVMVETFSYRGARAGPMLVAFVELGENWLDSEDEIAELSAATKERIYTVKQLVKTGLKGADMPAVIPSLFIPVNELPVTSSLKVDRRRLQHLIHKFSRDRLMALAQEPASAETRNMQLKPLPLTDSAERMRAIWARVLSVDKASIGGGDSFFQAGGDEFLASKLVIACRQAGIPISLCDVLRNASLVELSRAVLTAPDARESQNANTNALPAATSSSVSSSTNAAKTARAARAAKVAGAAPPNEGNFFLSDNFIETVIAPRMGISRESIKDVAEASATQIRHIESGMLRGRANIDYFIFHFTGAVNAKRLKEACEALVTLHPIMRTAFVPYSCRLYQAVIESFNVEFERYSTSGWRLPNLEDKMIRKDRSRPVTFCVPITKFVLLDAGKQSTLIMRLSKAQYDDLSIALLVKDLKRLYDGTDHPSQRPTYCEFMRGVDVANTQGGEEYWRRLLEGASMTQVVVHQKPYLISDSIKTIREVMPIGLLSNLGISFETVLKASWAMVMASLSASSDVVFGELVDGRHVRLFSGQSVAGVMGPTSCAIPVRVKFPDSALSPLALLQNVHAQRIAGIRFENYGFLNMVERCTSWPYWTRFSTLVQHVYEDTALDPLEPKTFHLGPAACRFSINESKAKDVADLFVQSVMRGASKVELKVSFCSERIPLAVAEQALHMLCAAVNMLTSVDIMQPQIPPGSQYRAMRAAIPLPLGADASAAVAPAPVTTSPGDRATVAPEELSEGQVLSIRNVVRAAWLNFLGSQARNWAEGQLQDDVSFYHLWGSLIPAAQIASYLSRELPKLGIPGLDSKMTITMEEIIDNADVQKQFELVVNKMKHPTPTEQPPPRSKEKAQQDVFPPAQIQAIDPTPSRRRKPTMSVTISSTPIGKGFRRIASTVTRASTATSTSTSPLSGTAPSGVSAATPATSRLAPNAADAISPLTPPSLSSPVAATVSREAPRLPVFPPFTPILEEPELERDSEAEPVHPPPDTSGNTARNVASFGNLSSIAESMTTGSSATSGDEPELANENDYLGETITGMTAVATTLAARPPSRKGPASGSAAALKLSATPVIRTGEEDVVSPVSVGSGASDLSMRSLEGLYSSSSSSSGSRAARPMSPLAGSRPSPLREGEATLRKKRSSLFGRIGLSPVFRP